MLWWPEMLNAGVFSSARVYPPFYFYHFLELAQVSEHFVFMSSLLCCFFPFVLAVVGLALAYLGGCQSHFFQPSPTPQPSPHPPTPCPLLPCPPQVEMAGDELLCVHTWSRHQGSWFSGCFVRHLASWPDSWFLWKLLHLIHFLSWRFIFDRWKEGGGVC